MSDVKRGLTADIYTKKQVSMNDCSNGGISSKHEITSVVVLGIDDCEIFEVREDRPAVKIVRRSIDGKPYYHAEPIAPPPDGQIGWMDGGSYIATFDSRFSHAVGGQSVVSLHDRCETVAQNRSLSI